MKTPISAICKASLALLLGTAAAMPVAYAQHTQALARATVPFSFQYGSRTFPAGRYTFGMVSDNIMALRGPEKSALGLVSWGDAKPSETGRLVFHRYGEQLTLQDIYVPQLSAHLHCPIPKQPRHHEVAAIQTANPDVEIALLESDH